jgi:hypothetical protein
MDPSAYSAKRTRPAKVTTWPAGRLLVSIYLLFLGRQPFCQRLSSAERKKRRVAAGAAIAYDDKM